MLPSQRILGTNISACQTRVEENSSKIQLTFSHLEVLQKVYFQIRQIGHLVALLQNQGFHKQHIYVLHLQIPAIHYWSIQFFSTLFEHSACLLYTSRCV